MSLFKCRELPTFSFIALSALVLNPTGNLPVVYLREREQALIIGQT